MIGKRELDREQLQPDVMYRLDGQPGIEYMMVKTAILKILHGTFSKCLEVTCFRILAQVMQGENFFQVRRVGLGRFPVEILNQVMQRRHRPPVIKGAILVRDDEYEQPVVLEHANPLPKSLNRIRDMLQHMRRNDEIVASGGNLIGVGCFHAYPVDTQGHHG